MLHFKYILYQYFQYNNAKHNKNNISHNFFVYCIFLLFFCFSTIYTQSNPKCRAKRYRCSSTILPTNICIRIEDKQHKYYAIQECEDKSYYCDINDIQHIEQQQYGKIQQDIQCKKKEDEKYNKMPNEKCDNNEQCYSKKCNNYKCQGNKYMENCIKHEDCNIGLYCDIKDKLCKIQKKYDEKCISDYECQNNTCCNKGICGFYFSIENNILADNAYVCKSGYIENGKCTEAPISQYRGQPCSSDTECIYKKPNDDNNNNNINNIDINSMDNNNINNTNNDVNNNDNNKITIIQEEAQEKEYKKGKCKCGINGSAFSYCELAEGDIEYIKYKRSILYILLNNEYCHTTRRFGKCEDIPEKDYEQYIRNKIQYEQYAQLQMNDICVAKTIKWEYWKYYMQNDIIKNMKNIWIYIVLLLLQLN